MAVGSSPTGGAASRAGIAQLAERLALNQMVTGCKFVAVAQGQSACLNNRDGGGSIPPSDTASMATQVLIKPVACTRVLAQRLARRAHNP
jgi:hypothetical protein